MVTVSPIVGNAADAAASKRTDSAHSTKTRRWGEDHPAGASVSSVAASTVPEGRDLTGFEGGRAASGAGTGTWEEGALTLRAVQHRERREWVGHRFPLPGQNGHQGLCAEPT